uniref:Uncharacterized protein n=1 Tax=Meloidogyne incognita TaxID=6306 RepID=A0A914M6P2_MELIC
MSLHSIINRLRIQLLKQVDWGSMDKDIMNRVSMYKSNMYKSSMHKSIIFKVSMNTDNPVRAIADKAVVYEVVGMKVMELVQAIEVLTRLRGCDKHIR